MPEHRAAGEEAVLFELSGGDPIRRMQLLDISYKRLYDYYYFRRTRELNEMLGHQAYLEWTKLNETKNG